MDKKEKFGKVMREFSKGKLNSSSGKKVVSPAQAKAIAYSESKKYKDGGVDFEGVYNGHYQDLVDKYVLQGMELPEAQKKARSKMKLQADPSPRAASESARSKAIKKLKG